ncbi:exportin-2 [Physcomitrium patens]|uniref:Importin N-terminal domain-containing protein n=2 Tax=Physcomitrium patens TaxID=3218 RepID=A9S7T7_PHYPA|nr:exportin-2-like [Physcomitrium patens]PNR26288.1 hypothetical protein PHYPA_030862 [Physcomitrium patens]|eukprot:XP_024367199.1 exportin-2-like [Physcomitrella patens]
MEYTQETLKTLSQCFLQTLAPNPEPRKQAESLLKQAADQAGYGMVIMQIVCEPSVDEQVRQAAAVNFKNHIKFRWATPDADDPSPVVAIQDPEKEQIKGAIVKLMLSTPPKIQSQLSEALAIMSQHDYPRKWQSLLPELVNSLSTASDYTVINGILQTANSIFKRFRYEFKSNELYTDLKYCLDGFCAPLLDIFQKTGLVIAANTENPAILKPPFECLRLCSRIFYSLNFQELPEFFEEHIAEWMGEFHKYLVYTNPLLAERDSEKTSVVDELKAAICENINLYMEKNEEEFQAYLSQFATDVWGLLMTVSLAPSQDRLATTAIKFLTTVSKSVHHKLFADPATLTQICESIVIPNVRIRDEDEELFDMNHVEYIRRDVEGSDLDTRRRMACELVKGLSTHYREQVTGMFNGYIQTMLQQYAAAPAENWNAKDCAIYLVVSLAPKQASTGAAGTDLVNFEQFFNSQIVPELRAQGSNYNGILKADALKFLTTFRTLVPKQLTLELMPQLIQFLVAEANVVHSYAALAIEKLLTIKDGRHTRYSAADLTPFLQSLFANLFGALKLVDSQENAYVMKCIMRVLSIADIGPFSAQCLGELTNILAHVCKNPTNPSFNHYLFEAVAALLRNACEKDPGQVATFENLLFPVFQTVLENDVTEFAPYVFQIMSQLLETRRPPIPPTYLHIFPALLTPLLWQRQANVPGLVRLLQAYLQKAPQEINQANQLTQVLGVFEKLVGSKNTDHQGFFILNTVVENLSFEALSPYMLQIWNILFSRLQYRSTVKFIKSLIIFSSLFGVKHGPQRVIETINSVQPELFYTILDKIWIPNLTTISGDIETKLCSVFATMLVAPLFQSSKEALVGKLVNNVMTLLIKPEEERVDEDKDVPDMDEVVGYVAVYAQLHNAAKKEDDPLKDIKDPKEFVAKTLAGVSQQYRSLSTVLQQGLEPANMIALGQFCSASSVALA